MTLALRQVETRADAAEWLPVDEAAALAGQSVRHWRRIATANAGKGLAFKASPRGGGKPVWQVHRSLDGRLTRYPTREERDDPKREALAVRFAQHVVERAYRRAYWLEKWRVACQTQPHKTRLEHAKTIVEEAQRLEGLAISVRTLQTWRAAADRIGPDGRLGIDGLIDRRSAPNATEGDGANRSPEAVEYFYSVFHAPNKLSVQLCHELTRLEAVKRGWTWPASDSATRKWLDRHDDLSLTYLMREGKDRWARRWMPHLTTDFTSIEVGQYMVTDHHECDFWVTYKDKQIRPWLTAVLDLRSRCVVGWHLGASPHTDAILAAYRMAFRDWSIPEHLKIDNGKDFTAKLLTGVTKQARDRLRREYGPDWRRVIARDEKLVDCTVDPRFMGIAAELGVELTYAIPYAPWSKGPVERWFRTFSERCSKGFPTYCGNSAGERPACLKEIRQGDVPTMEEARQAIGEYVDVYHATPHSGQGMNGRSPIEVWHTARSLRRAKDDELIFLMQARGVYKVTGNGVAFTVGATRMAYGATSHKLRRYVGREVFVTVDPADVGQAIAWTAEGRRFIDRLESNRRIPLNTNVDELREAIREKNHARKIKGQAQRSEAKRVRTVAQQVAASRREQHAALKATGTDSHRPNVQVVRTGFEQSSAEAIRATARPSVDRPQRDLTAAREALAAGVGLSQKSSRRRVSDSLLAWPKAEDAGSPEDEGDQDNGKDAGRSPNDLFRLLGRSGSGRHDNTE